MHKQDYNRVHFYSVEDMAGVHELKKAENILRTKNKEEYTDINDILELYNVKKYLDNGLNLKSWSLQEIDSFKHQAIQYGEIIGNFFSKINNENVIEIYQLTIHSYINSFWEILNNHSLFPANF